MRNSLRLLAVMATVLVSSPAAAQSRSLLPEEANVLRSMSDANILGHLASLDSLEISLSDSLVLRSKSDTVTGYAKAMRAAHAASRTTARGVASALGVPLTTLASEMNRTNKYARGDSVSAASDLTVDRHYLVTQLEMHDHMLAELQLLEEVARDARVKAHVRSRIPAVRNHLDYARSVAKARGVSTKPR
jgi:predicted outer membrane protein